MSIKEPGLAPGFYLCGHSFLRLLVSTTITRLRDGIQGHFLVPIGGRKSHRNYPMTSSNPIDLSQRAWTTAAVCEPTR